MDAKTKFKLRRLIRAHVNAQVALSWKGGTHPDDWPYIDKEAKKAAEKLAKFIKETL